jgi:hypothetical protein
MNLTEIMSGKANRPTHSGLTLLLCGFAVLLWVKFTENPRVRGSIPRLATSNTKQRAHSSEWAFCYLAFVAPCCSRTNQCEAVAPTKNGHSSGRRTLEFWHLGQYRPIVKNTHVILHMARSVPPRCLGSMKITEAFFCAPSMGTLLRV